MSSSLMMVMIVANAVIAVSYASIPVFLIVFARRRTDIPYTWLLFLFGLFILTCGATHFMHVIDIWWPTGWWQAAVYVLCAVSSVATAIVLWPVLPRLLAIPSPSELRLVNAQLQKEKDNLSYAQQQLERAYEVVEHRVAERTADLVVANTSLLEEIAARTRAETEIMQLNAELEQRVIDRTAQLEAANRELEAFGYTVSHDLRAPLRHIDGYAEMLASRHRDELGAQGVHYLDVILGATRHMGVLIDDLLRFSRTGRTEMRWETLNMNQVLREALEPVQASVAGRTVEWVIGDLPSVRGDQALLRQVWANLLGNAAKYTLPRDVARIEVAALDANEEVIFSVKDNGVGFDMQYAGKLFGVFQRLHSAEEFEGAGIGLATVLRIVSRHGGRVWAEAELDQGAEFFFTLPKPGEKSGD